jgi:hypothetical protein
MSKRWRWVGLAGFTAVLIFAAFCYLTQWAMISGYKNTILTELPSDLGNFYGEEKRLPANWSEFVTWSEKTHTPRHWTVDDLSPKFTLKWSDRVSLENSQNERIIEVLNPKLKDIEPYLNESILDDCRIADRYGPISDSGK